MVVFAQGGVVQSSAVKSAVIREAENARLDEVVHRLTAEPVEKGRGICFKDRNVWTSRNN